MAGFGIGPWGIGPFGNQPVPVPAPVSSGGTGTPTFVANPRTILGTDIFADDLDPQFRLVSGFDNLRQAILHRLLTPRGTLFYDDPNYGIDLRDFLNDEFTVANKSQVSSAVQAEIVKDPRITAVDVTSSYASITKTLTVSGTAVTAIGPFKFVVDVNAAQAVISG